MTVGTAAIAAVVVGYTAHKIAGNAVFVCLRFCPRDVPDGGCLERAEPVPDPSLGHTRSSEKNLWSSCRNLDEPLR